MYKVKNATKGTLCLKLEFSSIPLKSGATYDLDGVCSRQYIRNDPELRRLILSSNLIVLVDSEKNLEHSTIKDIAKVDQLFAKPIVERGPVKKSHYDLVQERLKHKKEEESIAQKIQNTSSIKKELAFLESKEPVFLDFSKILEEASREIPLADTENSALFIQDNEIKKTNKKKKRQKTKLEDTPIEDSIVEKEKIEEQVDNICSIEDTNVGDQENSVR